MQRRGFTRLPGASKILGLECAGTVASMKHCKRYQVGDAVCALLPGGGYAEYVAVDEGSALPIPAGFSFEQAVLPEVFATAWLNLFDEGALEKNSTVLIHAGASGVGTAAINCAEPMIQGLASLSDLNLSLEMLGLGAVDGSVRTAADFGIDLNHSQSFRL